MSTRGLLKTGHTIEPGIELLGGLAVAKIESGESLDTRTAQFRKDRGMTQAELAVIRIPADVVVQLAQILNISTDALLGLKAGTKKNGTVKNRRLLRQVQPMEKLGKRDQQALLRTIEAFLSKAG